LQHRSIAVDLLGRGDRPFDITQVSLDAAAKIATEDVRAASAGPFVVVAHSAGAMVAPDVAGRLGSEVRHLVFIAGLTAPHGDTVVDVLYPEQRPDFERRWESLRTQYANHTYARGPDVDASAANGWAVLSDAMAARNIESVNLMLQPVSWAGVPPETPRTWIRPLRDPIQTPEMQTRLIAACAATAVIDIDADHTPARTNPSVLASLLDGIAAGYDRLA
jgi:pimeloyl-ACP methyl ester carboxylesterase